MPQGSTAAQEQRGPTSGVHRAASPPAKPLLASEVLCDELAPLTPARLACRYWLAGIALTLLLLGLAFRFGVGVPESRLEAATAAFSCAGALVAVAVLPFPYALRAAVAGFLGVVVMTLGFRGAGPMGGIAVDGGLLRDLSRVITLSAVPAALFFRARYPAYAPSRWVLASALLLALPFIGSEVALALSSAGWLQRLGAVGAVVVVLLSLFGFMGEHTTGMASLWAVLLLLLLPAELGLRQFTPLASPETGYLTYPATALGLWCAVSLSSLGIYQLLAWFLAQNARASVMSRQKGKPPLKTSKA